MLCCVYSRVIVQNNVMCDDACPWDKAINKHWRFPRVLIGKQGIWLFFLSKAGRPAGRQRRRLFDELWNHPAAENMPVIETPSSVGRWFARPRRRSLLALRGKSVWLIRAFQHTTALWLRAMWASGPLQSEREREARETRVKHIISDHRKQKRLRFCSKLLQGIMQNLLCDAFEATSSQRSSSPASIFICSQHSTETPLFAAYRRWFVAVDFSHFLFENTRKSFEPLLEKKTTFCRFWKCNAEVHDTA